MRDGWPQPHGVAHVETVTTTGDARRGTVYPPGDLLRFLAPKGSVALDGVSLTINSCTATTFEIMLIPHTLSVTTLKDLAPGSALNIEVDLLARYLERLLLGDKASESSHGGISESFLAANGYLKS